MTLSIHSEIFSQQSFTSESELQQCLERLPALLISEQEDDIIFTHRELKLPAAGFLDLFCIDRSGTPIAVEVKLARNNQSRREVVAQVFDYVSDLSSITIDELDEIVDGNIYECLTNQDTDQNLWRNCAANLRAGMIKVVVAVDEANEDLVRIIRYINEHSDLDVRLVTISKYQNGDILVPNIIVSGNTENSIGAKSARRGESRAEFEAIISHYNTISPEELKTRNKARNYRTLGPANWPKSLHYEFMDHRDKTGLELHLEKDGLEAVASYLKSLAGTRVADTLIEWDPKWSQKRGRIRIQVPNELGVTVIVDAMIALINLTQGEISKILDGERLNTGR